MGRPAARRVMLTLLLYDVHRPALRVQIIAECQDRGLVRMQWSAFWGPMASGRRGELVHALHGLTGGYAGIIIHAVPLTREALRKMWVLEQGDVGHERSE